MTPRKTSADVIRMYNELAIDMPVRAWSKKFANARMEQAGGAGRVRLEYQVYVTDLGRWEPTSLTMSTGEAYTELSRLKARLRRYKRKQASG